MDKSVKIGKQLIKTDPELILYIKPPCSWRYHRCTDFNKYCFECNRNKEQWKQEPQEKSTSYFDPIGHHYH